MMMLRLPSIPEFCSVDYRILAVLQERG